MNHPNPPTRVEPMRQTFLPVAGTSAASIGLLALAAFGPKLWASQRGDDASIAVEIVSVGTVILAAIGWPLWTRSVSSSIGVIAAFPVWLLLAGQVAQASNAIAFGVGWMTIVALVVLAVARAITPRSAVPLAWTLILVLALAAPAQLYLFHDF